MTAIYLDSGPLGRLANPIATPASEAVRGWARSLLSVGAELVIPEIADYEVRRELLRIGRVASVRRLDQLHATNGFRYVPVTTDVFRTAAELWAEARSAGKPTADSQALDVDVVLAATLLVDSAEPQNSIIATTNVGHLSRFARTSLWDEITL